MTNKDESGGAEPPQIASSKNDVDASFRARQSPTTTSSSMRERFLEHHRQSGAELDRLWAECIFSLDANVLLNIYRYEDATRRDLFRVLRHVQNRIWIPYQVAKEFYAHRIEIITEQANKYEQISKAISDTLTSLNGPRSIRPSSSSKG
jgi:hypothetical protein